MKSNELLLNRLMDLAQVNANLNSNIGRLYDENDKLRAQRISTCAYDALEEFGRAILSNQKVNAIKAFRACTGAGLLESKIAVERILNPMAPRYPVASAN